MLYKITAKRLEKDMDDAILNEYFELLRFPTVGADPKRLRDCVDCAMWIKKWLATLGFSGELHQAPGKIGRASCRERV